jgi:N-sulfoglucosamine sulfohydrolase
MKLFRLALSVSACALCLLSSATGAGINATKPNIIVFISDDHGMLDAEPYGSTDIRTPNMARLAADGMKFTHAFVASPACGPSRTAMLTGLWSARNGAEPNHTPKRADVRSLPPALHALGYEVAAFGKVAHGSYAKDHGLDVIGGQQRGDIDTVEVGKFLAGRDASKPLCLFFGTHHPHVPWGENAGYDPAALKLPPNHVDTPVTREMRARYSSDVTQSDTLLGELRSLAQARVPGDTLFIYTADHGSQWPFGKWNLYDAGTRIPFIAAWPGHLKPASSSDAMICWPDMIPTFIELGGGTVPEGIDGRSFAGVLRGTTTTHRDRVFTTHSGDGDFNVYPIRSVRTRDWKYIRNLHPEFQHQSHISRSTGPSGLEYWKSWLAAADTDPAAAATVKRLAERPSEELYDINADPFELHNLAADPKQAGRLATLRAELDAWMKEQGDTQTVFGKPLLIGEPVTLLEPGAGKKKTKSSTKK